MSGRGGRGNPAREDDMLGSMVSQGVRCRVCGYRGAASAVELIELKVTGSVVPTRLRYQFVCGLGR